MNEEPTPPTELTPHVVAGLIICLSIVCVTILGVVWMLTS